jgi:zinc finger protein
MPELFNPIGEKAEKIAAEKNLDDATNANQPDGEDDRVVEEIESLCMNCQENVSGSRRSSPKFMRRA